jgi:hypothetical protein
MDTNNKNYNTYDPNKRSHFSKSFLKGKIYLVNPKFQFKFMFYVILGVVISLAVFYMANFLFFRNFIEKGLELNLPKDHSFFVILQEQQAYMTKVFIGASVILTGLFSVWGLLFSNKVAGPLFRLGNIMKEASKGPDYAVKKIHFRDGDFFAEVADSINGYFESIDKLDNGVKDSPQEDKAS